MRLGHMSEQGLRALYSEEFYEVLNTTNSIYVSIALWVDSRE